MMKHIMIAKIISTQPSIESINDLMHGLLTPNELAEIEQRIKIVSMLKANVPHHDIAKKLRVGVATVSRGAKELQNGRFSQIPANADAWRDSLD